MRIDAPTTPTTPTIGATPTAGLSPSRDQFLRLFIAQLEHQNPLDPQSGADMVAQLAQFTSVEQQVETNQRIADLAAASDAAASAGLAHLIGRTVTVSASSFELSGDGAPPAITLDASRPVAGGHAVVRDRDGRPVARPPIEPGPPARLAWAGTDDAGQPLPAGAYAIEVHATDAAGVEVAATPQLTAVVDALRFTADGPRLHLGAIRVSPAAVTTITTGGLP